jgi:hypothetical protein
MYQNNIYNEDSTSSHPLCSRNSHTRPHRFYSHLASEHLRPGHSISLRLISIIGDPSICALIRSREPDQTGWDLRSTPRNLQLMASRVELRARVCISRVQCDDLVADEVVAGCDASGDCVFDRRPGFHGWSVAPDVGGTDAAFFFDLMYKLSEITNK